jgi:LysM repeat protein
MSPEDRALFAPEEAIVINEFLRGTIDTRAEKAQHILLRAATHMTGAGPVSSSSSLSSLSSSSSSSSSSTAGSEEAKGGGDGGDGKAVDRTAVLIDFVERLPYYVAFAHYNSVVPALEALLTQKKSVSLPPPQSSTFVTVVDKQKDTVYKVPKLVLQTRGKDLIDAVHHHAPEGFVGTYTEWMSRHYADFTELHAKVRAELSNWATSGYQLPVDEVFIYLG